MQMTKDELERILHSLCSKLGVELPVEREVEGLLRDIRFKESLGDIDVPGILRRLEITVGRVYEGYPGIKPYENAKGLFLGTLPPEQKAQVYLGEIGNALFKMEADLIESIDTA
jgi:hypothetical protein